jgi:hypothetical protein
MRRIGIGPARVLVPILPLILAASAYGISCTTQSTMSGADRGALQLAAMAVAGNVQSGNAAAVKAQTIAPVAAQFDGIANSMQTVEPSIQKATLTVDGLYLLDATDLKSAGDAEFFCGLPGSTLTVEISIPNLPPGKYALAVVHATGVKNPQALSMVLANDPAASATWKVAGFFTRPMTMGGHDGVWFWQQARAYAAKKQLWNAYFYFQTAAFLLDPVDFISSPNLQKLQKETEQALPDGLPGGEPMHLKAGAQTFNVTNLHTGELSDQLDLVVTYQATPNQDPVAARTQVTAVMRALLEAHPELKSTFHGLWVYASTPDNQHPFALELPMDQIENSLPPSGQQSPPTSNQANREG